VISTGDLRRGVVIEVDGQLFSVLDYQHLKLGRGSAQVRMKLRNLRTGSISERTVQAGEKFTRVRLDNRSMQYSYKDGDAYVFMDQETYEQVTIMPDQLGDAVGFLTDGIIVEMQMYEGRPIDVELPVTVDLKVAQTAPGFKGDTAAGGTKPATLETGVVVNVPLFVNEGDTIRVDTRTGAYVTRV
jgi:elongation factor P